jgi:signal transduction histidine kinase
MVLQATIYNFDIELADHESPPSGAFRCCIHPISQQSARMLRLLADQVRGPHERVVRRFDRKPKCLASRRLFLLQGLPGVGPALARRLLWHFGSVERILTVDAATLAEVRGIGAGSTTPPNGSWTGGAVTSRSGRLRPITGVRHDETNCMGAQRNGPKRRDGTARKNGLKQHGTKPMAAWPQPAPKAPDMAGNPPDFQLLFEASPEVLLVLLPDAPRFTMVAATGSRLVATHTTREATIGRGLFEVFPDNPDDPEATGTSNLRASLERVIATRASDTMAVQKYDIRGPDGSFQVKYWSPKNIPVLSADGEVRYILHRVEDVTELVHASEEGAQLRGRTQEMEREVVARSLELAVAVRHLRDANAKLGELDAAKTAFFSNVSHEFRTPLTLMLGPLDDGLADSDEPLGPRQSARVELARDNALRLLKLVNALLDFSRLEAGRLRAHFAPLDISTFTLELAGMFQSAFERAGIRFVVDCRPPSGPVWVDRDMWEKIVPNLISNAFKFTLSGEISVRLRDEPDDVVLEVADTGSGIPEAELSHIFERFHRVAGASGRTLDGTGIGLALVRELVELHGGRVSVESEVGRGSTFRVTIPKGFGHLPADAISHTPADPRIARDAVAHAAEAASWLAPHEPIDVPRQPSAGSEQPEAMARARVLVVDDNPDLRAYVANLLKSTHSVVMAVDGVEALEAIRADPPDIVLSDVMMPRLDGFGLVRELRADPRTSSIPVILLSARAGEESAVQGLDGGADDYLVKPFSARELIARVRTHVSLSQARREWTAELERTNRSLEAANGELEAFSYSVSHDLRAPLRHVVGFAQMLEEHAREAFDERGRHYLHTITKSANHMARLIDDLLAFSRLGRGELAKCRVDLNAVVREVRAQVMEHEVAASRIVDWQIADLDEVKADPALLRQVFVNLLSNALKYSAPRDRTRIEVATETGDDGTIVVLVRDNGIGFDMAYKDRLFGVFQRLHRADEFDGTGIGLANVKRIIHRHGGRVWAEGEPDRGATFYFSLPAEN